MKLADDPEFNGEFKQRGLSAGINAVTDGIESALKAIIGDPVSPELAGGADMFQIPPEVLKYRNVIKDYQDRLTVDKISKSDLLTVSFDASARAKQRPSLTRTRKHFCA